MESNNGVFEVALELDPAISKAFELADESSGSATQRPIMLNEFEKNRWPYLLALPVMWVLTIYVALKKGVYKLFGKKPAINTLWFDGLGKMNCGIKNGAASWKALDIIYNHVFNWRNPFDDFWIGMMNAQAVRNRFKLVRQEVRRAIMRFQNQGEVRIISLACGSAEAIIKVIAEYKAKGVIVRALLVDRDETALEYAKNLAIACGVIDRVETRKDSVSRVIQISEGFRPHIIEMLGLLDYIQQDKAIRLAEKIKQSLEPNGLFLTCNIKNNPEKMFLLTVIDWWMIYRTPQELADVAMKSGFSNFRVVYEPLEIHGILIAEA